MVTVFNCKTTLTNNDPAYTLKTSMLIEDGDYILPLIHCVELVRAK